MENKEMPDVVHLIGAGWKGQEFIGVVHKDQPNAIKYHADHIVQRLEREKAELTNKVGVLETEVSALVEVLRMVEPIHYARLPDTSRIYEVLQKHEGEETNE